MITTLTEENFEEFINSDEPVLVDLWATWCGPCMMQGEILHAMTEAHPAVSIGKVNVDECGGLAARFGIEEIPTMIIFKEGKVLETLVGMRQAEELLSLLRKYGAGV